jgi:hypothetical protein
MDALRVVLSDFVRFVLFKPLKGDVPRHWLPYLTIGLFITWIVGIGRTWDNSYEPLWLRSGLPSVAYAVVLAGFIWVVVAALRPGRWTYRNVLLMVTMTAAPGLIYAIPVEQFLDHGTARATNLIFLAIVAAWRMALYFHFLRSAAKLPPVAATVAALLPPTLILAVVSAYGALEIVAGGMGGTELPPGESIAASVLFFIAASCWIALPILVVAWLALAVIRSRPQRQPPLD